MTHRRPPDLVRLLSATDAPAREAAWERFLRTHTRLILHACRRPGTGHDTTMDRYAYVIERLGEEDFRRLRAFDEKGSGKFSSWLIVVVRRLCVDHHRQKYGRTGNPGPSGPTLEQLTRRRLAELVGEELDLTVLEDRRTTRPDAEVERTELWEALESAVESLPTQDQLLITLRFKDGLSVRKIAKILGQPNPFRLYRRIDAILSSLRARLERAGFTTSEP